MLFIIRSYYWFQIYLENKQHWNLNRSSSFCPSATESSPAAAQTPTLPLQDSSTTWPAGTCLTSASSSLCPSQPVPWEHRNFPKCLKFLQKQLPEVMCCDVQLGLYPLSPYGSCTSLNWSIRGDTLKKCSEQFKKQTYQHS